jgi:hypothetical protein
VLIPLPPRPIQDHIAQVMQDAYTEANRLRIQAENLVNKSKTSLERMILGEEEVK